MNHLRFFDISMYDRRLAYLSIWQRFTKRQLEHGERKAGPVKTWPQTLYPNILAELDASCWFLGTVRDHIRVSQEILWAVLEDGEQLTGWEMSKLAELFNCGAKYLRAPKLQIVYMESNKGKLRRAILGAMLQMIPPVPGEDYFVEGERQRAVEVFKTMASGNPVTYAAWRQAVGRCEYVMEARRREAHKPRTARLA